MTHDAETSTGAPAAAGRLRRVPLAAGGPPGPPAARASSFAAPYAVFLAAVFAYPLGLAVWMSFHDYFFAAPGAEVDRPFVGLDNYTAVLTDPAVRRVVPQRRRCSWSSTCR